MFSKKSVANYAGKDMTLKELEALELSEKTSELILSGNSLSKLPAALSRKCPNLTVLKIDKNKLAMFPTIPIVRRHTAVAVLCLMRKTIIPTQLRPSLVLAPSLSRPPRPCQRYI